MKQTFACLSCVLLLSAAAFSQTDAEVHPSVKSRTGFFPGPVMHEGRLELRYATMLDLITTAYGLDADNVFGGPSWLETDQFHITAKPDGKGKEARNALLQAILTERFALKLGKETRPMPALALTAGKHPALKASTDEAAESGCKFQPVGLDGQPFKAQVNPAATMIVTCTHITMASFAEQLKDFQFSSRFLGNVPIVDQTALTGAWDFTYKFSFPNRPQLVQDNPITIFDAFEKQLGLKLEPTKSPMPVVVVASVNETPTPNSPGVEARLGMKPLPTEFELATLKPTDPGYTGPPQFQVQPGGRLNVRAVTVLFMIQQAWGLPPEMVIGAPKGLDDERYDLVAKAPESILVSGENSPPVDIDSVLLMLRSMLGDRFKLKYHFEDRPVTAYTLTALKPKMKKADPTSRTRFREGPAPDAAKNDPRNKNPLLARLVSCQNMTMAQFAERLQDIAPGYIHSPVLDATGLDGAYDFTLSFTPAGGVGRAQTATPAPTTAGDIATAADPNGAVTLFEAIERQLGLKLQQQKRPVSVLVIDHVEQKPTEN